MMLILQDKIPQIVAEQLANQLLQEKLDHL